MVAVRICAVHELVNHTLQFPIIKVNVLRIVAAVILVIDNLLRAQSEDKRILFSYLLDDLDIRAVHGAERRSAVEHEFHISCT